MCTEDTSENGVLLWCVIQFVNVLNFVSMPLNNILEIIFFYPSFMLLIINNFVTSYQLHKIPY